VGSNPTPRIRENLFAKIFPVIWNSKKEGRRETTLKPMSRRLKNIAKNVDLDNPEKVKEYIAALSCSDAYKDNLVDAYNHYVQFYGLKWEKPFYERFHHFQKIPKEESINKIISHASLKYATAYSVIRDTGLRPIELGWLKPKDFDLETGDVYPTTAKHGEGRILRIKQSTLVMLKRYIAECNIGESEVLWDYVRVKENWIRLKNAVAKKLGEPELKSIRLYDLRHFVGSMTYYKTRDIVHVQRVLGHRNIKNTLRYIHLVNFDSEEFIVKVAKTLDEACKLLEAGFEYVTEMDGAKIFRKRK